MAITIECSCGQKLLAKDSQIGKTLRCPKCGIPTTVRPRSQDGDLTATVYSSDGDVKLATSATETSQTSNSPSESVGSQLSPNSKAPIRLSTAALAVSLVTACWVYVQDPLTPGLELIRSGIGKYNFTSPQDALISQLQIEMNNDMRAAIEVERMRQGRTIAEKLETIKVHKDSNYEGKKILFISFTENGLPKHDTAAFEKDADSGYWFPVYVATYDMSDEKLKEAIEDWTEQVDRSSD